MRAKILFSLCAVVGLSALAIAALVSTAQQTPAKPISEQNIAVADASATSVPEETQEPEETEKAEQTPEQTPEQYRSKIHSTDWDADESYLLAKIAMAEAEGEDVEGKALVILVVLNRVWSDEFPDTIESVIYQKGQFSPISNGRFDRVEPDEDCWLALDMVQSQHWDESQGATYFESKSDSAWHSENLKFLFKHGNHYFYEDKE
jgi:N-acetylmuramoyl-L-alanine amidase